MNDFTHTFLHLSGPIDLSLVVKDAESVEIKWKNPKQNTHDLAASVRYRDTDTVGSTDVTVPASVTFGQAKKLLSGLQPNTIYRVEVCICMKVDGAKCACNTQPLKAATKPLGKFFNTLLDFSSYAMAAFRTPLLIFLVPEIESLESIGDATLKISWKPPLQRKVDLYYASHVTPAFGGVGKVYSCEASAEAHATCTVFALSSNTKYNVSMYAHRTPDGSAAYGTSLWYWKTRPKCKCQ